MAGLLRLIRRKWSPPMIPTTTFEGKTVLITGSNTGLGLEAAKHFFSLSASTLILAVRDISKVLPLEMSSYSSITNFIYLLSNQTSHLDIAILNAGIMTRTFTMSPHNWEQTLQINAISTALLALLVLPFLRAAKSPISIPHLILVSSGTHRSITRSSLSPSGTNILRSASNIDPEHYDARKQYAISKLFVMYVTKSLAAICTMPTGEADVIVTACCPGACRSDLGREYDSWLFRRVVWWFGLLFQRSGEEGSRTFVSAGTLGVEAMGGWWQHDELMPFSELVTSEKGKDLGKQVWSEIINSLKEDVPQVETLARSI